MAAVQIESSWGDALADEFSKPYFGQIVSFLKAEKAAGKVIYPKGNDIFNAFNYTAFDAVKVVIIGQDPYHNPGQANGLCFSVSDGVPPPPSLVNIYKEIKEDLGLPIPASGDLSKWARQGVLLLNATLTVEAHKPNAHSDIGWQVFTDAVIRKVAEEKKHVVFLLWGKFAQGKAALINADQHLILKAAHPSPFSAYNGFFGCKHFSKANEFLHANKLQTIDWSL
ncbi:MAG TPA: uracil-DNA glycosylase [Chitinophagaceae bacterium]|nr:uracil-DNA glycosylase [Chitinophagaceae bacterium]